MCTCVLFKIGLSVDKGMTVPLLVFYAGLQTKTGHK